jgi:hypothetical protein
MQWRIKDEYDSYASPHPYTHSGTNSCAYTCAYVPFDSSGSDYVVAEYQ